MDSCTIPVNFGPERGRGLITTRDITSGETLIVEEPLLCCQFAWNRQCGYLACDHCLRPLESAQINARRLTGDETLTLPYQSTLEDIQHPIYGATTCYCTTCGAGYCSSECCTKAASLYHSILCFKQTNKDNPIDTLDEVWRQIHYPPETNTIFLLLRIVAVHFSAYLFKTGHAQEIIDSLNAFVSSTVVLQKDFRSSISHKLLRPEFLISLNQLHEAFVAVLFYLADVHLEKVNGADRQSVISALRLVGVDTLVDLDKFKSAICLLGRNGQGIATSAFSVWANTTESILKSTGDNASLVKFENQLESLYKTMDAHVGSFLDNEGVGLYKYQSLLNHSCQPNAEVRFSGDNNRLSVVALDDIPVDQEVTISYLDACQLTRSRHSRRQALAECYLFWCDCSKCYSEGLQTDVSETSEEDDDTNNSDCGAEGQINHYEMETDDT